MSRPSFHLLVVSMLVLLLAGCRSTGASQPTSTPVPKEVQLTEEGGLCGSAVGLNAGDILVLILEGNPSTGYSWEVGFYVPEVIAPSGEPEIRPESNLAGAPATYTFRFLAVGEGEATLRLTYHRPAEKDAPDLKTCEVTVKVN